MVDPGSRPPGSEGSWTPAILLAAVLCGAWGAQLLRPEAALRMPAAPWSWILVLAPAVLAAAAGVWRPHHPLLRDLGSARLAMAALLAVAATCWPIAVFPVGVQAPGWLRRVGLGDPLTALPFAVALAAVALNLACSLGRRLRLGPDRGRYALLHLGILIAVLGAAAGNGGLVRARFVLEEGAPPVSAAVGEDGAPVHLPMGIRLDDFVLERFPPMLLLAEADGHLVRGEVLLAAGAEDRLGGLHVRVVSWLDRAMVAGEVPVAFGDPSADPAARVEVADAAGAVLGSGWLHPAGSDGGSLFLSLTGGRTLHLEQPRPRRFLARVRVDGEPAEIVVNAPLRRDGWAVYLLSYDERLGAASRTAVFEAVEDRALPAVYLGIAMLLGGVLLHLWRPRTAGARP